VNIPVIAHSNALQFKKEQQIIIEMENPST
jgi:hypothetical protein